MASLTPGILSKLVENAGNKEVRVTGEHRSALLQVIEIVPSLSPSDHANPWHSKGFFLKLSDSLHCAYVSISQEDLDLVYSDKIQLGQFVYVSRFDLGSPVPVLRGLKPVPRRRVCVGSPKDLVSAHLLPITSTNLDDKKIEKKRTLVSSKKGGLVKNAAAERSVEKRRLSLDSARRIWDHTPLVSTNTANIAAPNFKPSTNGNFHKKGLSKNDQSLKSSPLSVSPLRSRNDLSSAKGTAKNVKKDTISSAGSAPTTCLLKVPLNSETWSAQQVSWSALPPKLRNIGKETVCHKNAAILAAARALEEASASESVIHCMQAFADLCKSSKKVSLGSMTEQYLDLHQDMLKVATAINSLLHATPPESKSIETKSWHFSNGVIKATASRQAVLWVHAALETNLSKFSLFKKPQDNEIIDKYYFHVILENSPQKLHSENKSPQGKPSSRIHGNLADSSAKKVPPMLTQHQVTTKKIKPQREDWPMENRLKDAASLAEKLLSVSRQWFMEYIDNLLSTKIELSLGNSHEVAHLLRQLKRVDQWLNDLVGNEVKVDRSVENLRKKLCGFLLEQVDSALLDGK